MNKILDFYENYKKYINYALLGLGAFLVYKLVAKK